MPEFRFAKYNHQGKIISLTEYTISGIQRANQCTDHLNKVRSEMEIKLGIVWRHISSSAKVKVVKEKCSSCGKITFSNKCYECRKRGFA